MFLNYDLLAGSLYFSGCYESLTRSHFHHNRESPLDVKIHVQRSQQAAMQQAIGFSLKTLNISNLTYRYILFIFLMFKGHSAKSLENISKILHILIRSIII